MAVRYRLAVTTRPDAIPVHRRLAVRVTATNVLLVALTIAYFAVRLHERNDAHLQESFGRLLEHIVVTAAPTLDGDAHREIRSLDDTGSPAFLRIQAQLRAVQQGNDLREDLLYTFNFLGDVPVAAVMLQEVPYTGDTYTPPPVTRALLARVRSQGESAHSPLYTDVHGEWISGYAPILDSQGALAGVLAADFDVSTVRARSRQELQELLGLSLGALLLAVGLSLPMARRLERDLGRIRAGADAIEREQYDHRIPVGSRDELGLVAGKFNHMAEVLAERFHLLKFLPAHTREAIEQRALGGQATAPERIDATILFSDIRGYTALSNRISDEALVTLLDTCLRHQATRIQAAGGTIDKFIGDAVLAVFSGPERDRRAVQAGLDIQADLVRLNGDGSFSHPVQVGIGIASGSLMLAELGSEDRRERTIIGSVVNLAARLCGQAGEGEVVVSGAVVDAVGPALHVSFSRDVELKGFGGQQGIHLVAGLEG